MECCDCIGSLTWRPAAKEPDHRHRRLLRARRERPRHRRAAEQCDELAPFHSHASRASDTKDSTPPNGRRLLHPSHVRRTRDEHNHAADIFSKAAQAVNRSCHDDIEFPPAGVLEHGIEARPSVSSLGAGDACVAVDLHDVPTTPPGDLPKLADLIFNGLRVRAYSHIQCRALSAGHWRPRLVVAQSETIPPLYLFDF